MTEAQIAAKIEELEKMKERLIALTNELLVFSDSFVYTALHLNEAKNILTRAQREISKSRKSPADMADGVDSRN